VAKRTPDGPPPPPTVQRVRIQYTKRGRLRFTSHRDIARAFERALRRAQVPMAYSAGFSPHPKISWVGAAPTGVASEAEYVEIGLAEHRDLAELSEALDESLPAGIDIVDAVDAPAGTSLPDRIEASRWAIRLPGTDATAVQDAVDAFLAADTIPVERLMKAGLRTLDARAAVVSMRAETGDCAILHVVVRHVTPAVRPDVLSGLRIVADLVPPVPPEATRYAQGPLTETGEVGDPLAPDRMTPDGVTRQDADRDEEVVGSL
jgi:radical SAM-linked protein